MNWDDEGFLISKNRYSENSLISEVYTKSHGKVSGIIFGGTSKKIKNRTTSIFAIIGDSSTSQATARRAAGTARRRAAVRRGTCAERS